MTYFYCFSKTTIFHICTIGQDSTSRFNRAMGISLSENIDGKAIEYVAKKFSHRLTRKLLIVLSDGRPQCPGYGRGIEHTRHIVQQVRQQGIDVMAVSLIEDVRESNNNIYGREYNLTVTDGDVASSLREVILQFV